MSVLQVFLNVYTWLPHILPPQDLRGPKLSKLKFPLLQYVQNPLILTLTNCNNYQPLLATCNARSLILSKIPLFFFILLYPTIGHMSQLSAIHINLPNATISFTTCATGTLFNFTSFNQNNYFTISKFFNTSLLPVVDIHCEGCNLKFTKRLDTAQHATCLSTKNRGDLALAKTASHQLPTTRVKGSISQQSTCELLWKQRQWNRFFSQYFRFLLLISFHQCSILAFHSSNLNAI